MNSQITDFALAGKCGARGARGSTTPARAEGSKRPVSCNSPASASRPAPPPARRNISRRLINEGSFHIDEFVKAEQNLRKIGQRQIAGVGFVFSLVSCQLLCDESDGLSALRFRWRAAQCEGIGPGDGLRQG